MKLVTIILILIKMVPGNDSDGKISPAHGLEAGAVFPSSALTINSQPVDLTDCKGNKVTFSVATQGGEGTIHYLWKRKRPADSEFLSFGAKDSMKLPVYNIGSGTEAPDKTMYQVIISDQTSEVTSLSALLSVNQITGILPVGVAVYNLNEGENLDLKVLTSGNLPTAIQWIKKYGNNDWRDVTDNSIVTGSRSEQLRFTKISVRDSGIYKVRVTFPTANNSQCTETSQITRTIHVKQAADTESPLFVNLPNRNIISCPDDLEKAEWNEVQQDIMPVRTNFYRLNKFNTLFDLSTEHFYDNVTPVSELTLHWGIFSAIYPYESILDEAATVLDSMTGQISLHPENIDLESLSNGSKTYRITYWLADRAGNTTPDSARHSIFLTVPSRPEIISNF